MRARSGIRWGALGVVLALAIGACGGSDSGANESTAPTTAVATPTEEVETGGVLRAGIDLVQSATGEPSNDPVKEGNQPNDSIMYLIFGRLMRPTLDGGLEPDLAESTTIVDENTIDIVVREGVTFHDGSPFDAAAVKAGLDRTLASNNQSGLTGAFGSLETVEVTGPNTVRLGFTDGSAPSWHDTFMASWQTTIVKPDTTDFDRPVGAGPMKVVDAQRGQSLTLEKYSDYWDAESIALDGIEFVHTSGLEPQAGSAALRSGLVDMVITDPTQVSAMTGKYDVYAQENPTANVTAFVCKTDGPLANPLARKAINKAIDREAISEAAFAGTAQPSVQPWPEGYRFYNSEVGDELGYDPDAARALLVEAGYPDGFSFDFYVLGNLGNAEAGQVIQAQLEDVGITASIKPVDNNGYVQDFLLSQAPGAGLNPGGAPNRVKLGAFTGDTLGNVCKYSDPELDALYSQLAGVSDSSDEAVELWSQMTDIIVEDALSIFVVFRSNLAGYDTERVGGLSLWPFGTIMAPNIYTTYVKGG